MGVCGEGSLVGGGGRKGSFPFDEVERCCCGEDGDAVEPFLPKEKLRLCCVGGGDCKIIGGGDISRNRRTGEGGRSGRAKKSSSCAVTGRLSRTLLGTSCTGCNGDAVEFRAVGRALSSPNSPLSPSRSLTVEDLFPLG